MSRVDGSPVGAGIWIWPRRKPTAQSYAQMCRDDFSIEFADGRYIALVRDLQLRLVVDETDKCSFTQLDASEVCDVSVSQKRKTRTKVNYYRDAQGTLKATGAISDGKGFSDKIEFFAVRCSDNLAWDFLQQVSE